MPTSINCEDIYALHMLAAEQLAFRVSLQQRVSSKRIISDWAKWKLDCKDAISTVNIHKDGCILEHNARTV